MPRVFGRSLLHVSEVDAIVENNVPLLELPTPTPGPEDRKIALIVAQMVSDGACLQMGVGSLPNLVCAELGAHRDLGIHTECFTPGMVQLIESGVVNNRRKQINIGKSVFTFAMGRKATYQFLHNNPSVESHPVNYVNDPAVIAKNDNVVSINSALQIDLTGACNAEHLLGINTAPPADSWTLFAALMLPAAANQLSPWHRQRPTERSRESFPGSTRR